MGIWDFIKEKKLKMHDIPANKTVHDTKNRYTSNMIRIHNQANIVNKKIDEARKASKRLQRMLTKTEIIYRATGGK